MRIGCLPWGTTANRGSVFDIAKSFIDERIVGRHDGLIQAKGIQPMKKYGSIIHIISLACAGLIFTGCATNQATAPIPPNSGRLLINRVANFGSDLSLVLSIDGKDVEALPRAEVTVGT